MPIIKSAKKKVRQAEKHRKRNLPLKTEMKTFIKKFLDLVKGGKKEDATKLMPKAFKLIDTAAKKHIIHRRNADNKKARLARVLTHVVHEVKTAEVKKGKPSKEVVKKAVKKEKPAKKEKKEKK